MMITHQIGTEDPNVPTAGAPSETLERLRIAAASRASLLRAAHVRLEDDLRDLRTKATSRS